MKVCHFSKNFSSQNKLILKIQSSIELSQIQGILSNYSEVFLFFAKYNFLFENVSSETQHLKNIRTNIESSLSTQDPARDGWNWYGYCGQNPINFQDVTGLEFYGPDGVHSIYDDPYVAPDVKKEMPRYMYGDGNTYSKKVPKKEETQNQDTNIDIPTNSNLSGKEKNADNKQNNTRKSLLRDIYLKLSFKKKSQILVIDSYMGNKKVHSRSIRVTNNVRSPESRGKPVKFRNYYYYPGEFPDGEWNVTGAGFDDSNPDIGPYIKTDAGAWVDTWQKNEEGNWEKTGDQVYDTGYLFHGSDGEQNTQGNNNENYSTWGCGRGKNADIVSVGLQVLFVINGGGTVTVTVGD